MPRKKKIDGGKLIKAVQQGRPSTEIMAEFGFKNSAQLKAYYVDALMEKGDVPELVTARSGKKDEKKSKSVKVTKRGSISIPKELVEAMGFKEGDAFIVRKTKAGVSLKKE